MAGIVHLLRLLDKFTLFMRTPGEQLPSERSVVHMLAQLPRTIRSLAVDDLDKGMVNALGLMIAHGSLPLLEELCLPYVSIGTVEQAEDLRIALGSPVAETQEACTAYFGR